MALVDCPECNWKFSQYAEKCPKCGFPNPLSNYPVSNKKALAEREDMGVQVFGEAQPVEVQQVITQPKPHIRTIQETPAPEEHTQENSHLDKSLNGFFHGRAPFWFALCIHYLGVLAALAVATVALEEPKFMIYVFGGYAFVGLFVLLWTTKNIANDLSKWLVRIVIVLLLLVWMGAST